MPAEIAVDQPEHPLPQLATFELRDYRRALETAIARAGPHDPASPALQIRLDAVIAEQQSRATAAAEDRTL